MSETVTRKVAIKEIRRQHHLDREMAAALVDAAIETEQRRLAKQRPPAGLSMMPFHKQREN